jgi:ubiquitin-conjugating enzyme (huntingtin interacting protein 2)
MSTSARAKRITKEIREASADPLSKIVIEMIRDDINNLKGRFPGPPDTPYEGGIYVVEIKIPSEYPFRPPKMKFETKVWHPNVSSQTVSPVYHDCLNIIMLTFLQGAICVDTLSTGWSPVLTIKSALMMLQSLLASPEPKDPQDAEVASMMIKKPEEFKHKARKWAIDYAGAPRTETAEGSGGATSQSIRMAQVAAKKLAPKPETAQCVYPESLFHTPLAGDYFSSTAFAHLLAVICFVAPTNIYCRYNGYNKDLVGRFVEMGFEVPQVVAAFEYVGIDRMDGMDYELEQEYMGDITARLFNEP